MRRVFVLLVAGGLVAAMTNIKEVPAGDRPLSDDIGAKRTGNWSRADQPAANSGTEETGDSGIPVPRPKPGSKAAKSDAVKDDAAKDEAAKDDAGKEDAAKAKAATAKKAKIAKSDDKKVPVPRTKELPEKPVQAGIVPSEDDGGESSAPYRGNLDSEEIRELLSGKVLTSRIDGKTANITLAEGGDLNWTSTAGEGQGKWWAEKGRICDRYDPSGDFPGRGAGCRSFEQKPDGYYAGGRKLKFAN